MKRRQVGYGKRKPIVQLDDAPRANYGLGFKKETESGDNSPFTSLGCYEEEDCVEINTESANAQGPSSLKLVQFVKGAKKTEETVDELDSKLNDFLKEINELDFSASPTSKNKNKDDDDDDAKKKQGDELPSPPKEPAAPTCSWQVVLDESTQCYYYWNMNTNQSTWEIPDEYTKYLELYKDFEESYAKYSKEMKQWMKLKDQEKTDVVLSLASEEAKISSPSLVPYDCADETGDDNMQIDEDPKVEQNNHDLKNDCETNSLQNHSELSAVESRTSRKRSNGSDESSADENDAKRVKLSVESIYGFVIDPREIKEQTNQIEEIGRLTMSMASALEKCGHSHVADEWSLNYIQAAVQTRIEDWKAGYLASSYVIQKLRQCLTDIQDRLKTEEPPSDSNSMRVDGEEVKVDDNNEAVETDQSPPPLPTEPDSSTAPPPPPPESDDENKTNKPYGPAPRSLLSLDYGEGSDDENEVASEISTPTYLEAVKDSSPLQSVMASESPPRESSEERDVPSPAAETNTKCAFKVASGSMKAKPLMTASLSMKKKKVSSMVEKWQKVQQELEE